MVKWFHKYQWVRHVLSELPLEQWLRTLIQPLSSWDSHMGHWCSHSPADISTQEIWIEPLRCNKYSEGVEDTVICCGICPKPDGQGSKGLKRSPKHEPLIMGRPDIWQQAVSHLEYPCLVQRIWWQQSLSSSSPTSYDVTSYHTPTRISF